MRFFSQLFQRGRFSRRCTFDRLDSQATIPVAGPEVLLQDDGAPCEAPNDDRDAVFRQAMAFKRSGELSVACDLLITSCDPPSIYKTHYRELFAIWRELNARDLEAGRFDTASERVFTMIRYDEEMIEEMLLHWGNASGRNLPHDHFDRFRNLELCDLQVLVEAANALGDEEIAQLALDVIQRFPSNWKVEVELQ